MINTQAIDLLRDLEQCLDDYCELNDEGKTAFHMAIKALELFGNTEQSPSAQPETHEKRTETHACDLISRQAAIEAITDELDRIDHVPQWVFDRLEKRLKQLPPAQPEVICCKDCKWFGNIGCAISIVDDSDKPTENDFCSFAERRES